MMIPTTKILFPCAGVFAGFLVILGLGVEPQELFEDQIIQDRHIQLGQGRVAGFDADIVQLDPRDGLRFGYRIWSEKRTGLVVKTQTLDDAGRVLEQAAFSELQLDAPVQAAKLDPAALPTGSDRPWVSRSADGLLVLKP